MPLIKYGTSFLECGIYEVSGSALQNTALYLQCGHAVPSLDDVTVSELSEFQKTRNKYYIRAAHFLLFL